MIETLESRMVFSSVSSAVVVSVHKAVLKIVGTEENDRISLSGQSGALTLSIDGHEQLVQSRVRSVYIYGGDGNDKIFGNHTTFPEYIVGGPGNDTLVGGEGTDTIFGGAGRDVIRDFEFGAQPIDYQDGGPGDDILSDGGTMNGGSGYDRGDAFNAYDVIHSGIENFLGNNSGSGTFDDLSNQVLRGHVYTNKGRLGFAYVPNANETGISAPYLRPDDKVGINVISLQDDLISLPNALEITLNARYTELALSRGLILSFDGVLSDGSHRADRALLVFPR